MRVIGVIPSRYESTRLPGKPLADILGEPIFRQREVPRMLELATARADGDTSVPAELVNYPARSRAGRERRAPS